MVSAPGGGIRCSWGSIVAIGLLCGLFVKPEHAAKAAPVRRLLPLQALAFAGLAGAQTLGSWRDDLLKRRRQSHLFTVTAPAGYTIAATLSSLLANGLRRRRSAPFRRAGCGHRGSAVA